MTEAILTHVVAFEAAAAEEQRYAAVAAGGTHNCHCHFIVKVTREGHTTIRTGAEDPVVDHLAAGEAFRIESAGDAIVGTGFTGQAERVRDEPFRTGTATLFVCCEEVACFAGRALCQR
jgi:hypothetical protein